MITAKNATVNEISIGLSRTNGILESKKRNGVIKGSVMQDRKNKNLFSSSITNKETKARTNIASETTLKNVRTVTAII